MSCGWLWTFSTGKSTFSRLGARETTVGADVMGPPSDSQSVQVKPSHQRYHKSPSFPIAKTSSRLGAEEATDGADVKSPPRFSQSLQKMPFHHVCHSA